MLHTLSELEEFAIHATDGIVGKVIDFYFDDEHWVVRYLVVETGVWLSSRKILLSPISVREFEWEKKQLDVVISRGQVKDSPDIDLHKPVSRQNEIDYLSHFGYPLYWGNVGIWGSYANPYMMAPGYHINNMASLVADEKIPAGAFNTTSSSNNHHLRSNSEVIKYRIEATDGALGHLQGMLIDPETWAIRYLIVNTSNWWLGHLVLVAPEWIKKVSWRTSRISVHLTQAQIKDGPVYDPDIGIDHAAEEALHSHYGRKDYWESNQILHRKTYK